MNGVSDENLSTMEEWLGFSRANDLEMFPDEWPSQDEVRWFRIPLGNGCFS